MHSVLRNEIIFLVTFVWPLSILLALLLAPPGRRRRRGATALLILGGPVLALARLARLAREAPRPARMAAPVARPSPPRRPPALVQVLASLAVALLATGVAIFFHPGWTGGYYALLDVHAALGYVGWLVWIALAWVHVRAHVSVRAAWLALAVLAVATVATMGMNEVNRWVLAKVPVVLLGAWAIRALRRELGPAVAERAVRAGLALFFLGTVTFATGAYVTEPFNSWINNNMGLYVLYVHGGVPLLLLPLVGMLARRHVGAAGSPRRPGRARAVRAAATATFAAGVALSSVWVHVKWFGPDGGLHLWPPSDFAGLYAALPGLSPAHRDPVRTDSPRGAPVPASPGRYAASLDDSAVCGSAECHPILVEQWEHSSHRHSASNRFFRRVVERLRETGAAEAIQTCQRCHDPVGALFEPQGAPGVPARDWTASRGVTCKACHLITSVDHGAGNGVYTLREEMPYPVRAGEPGYERTWMRFIRADLRLHFRNYANADLFEAAEFCTACHRLTLPPGEGREGSLVVSDRYESWSRSDYAARGVPCMSCHMAEWRRDVRGVRFPDHRMPGLNVTLSRLVDDPSQREGLEAFEQLTHQWIRGVGPLGGVGPVLGVRIEAPAEAAPGGQLGLTVVTTNRRVGHDFPAGPADLNQVWLHVRVVDASGATLFESGALDASGHLDDGAHRLGATLVDREGLPVRHHEILRTADIRDRRELPPGGTTEDRFEVPLPASVPGPLTIEARWLYRRARPEFVRWVYGDEAEAFPAVELATGRGTAEVRAPAAASAHPSPSPSPSPMDV